MNSVDIGYPFHTHSNPVVQHEQQSTWKTKHPHPMDALMTSVVVSMLATEYKVFVQMGL